MQKKYIFTLDKYYNDEEIAKVSPIIENFVGFFADENGVATLKLKDDVSVVIDRGEGLVLHMVLDNAEHFTALPKKLTRAKDFLNTFIAAMAKEVDTQVKKVEAEKKRAADIESAKAKVESDAENSLFDYIGGATPAVDTAPETKATVKVNGEEVTDPAERQKVIDDVDAKVAAMRERAAKVFNDTFDNVFKALAGNNDDWLKKYLG